MAEQGECSMEESSGRSPAGEGRGGRELGAFPCSSSRLHLEATGPPSVLQSKLARLLVRFRFIQIHLFDGI
jgi:hypothetical protein